MHELTGKQKSFLRGVGQTLRPLLAVGKAGLTPGTVRAAAELLSRRELVKVRLPAGPAAHRETLARLLAEATGAACAGMVGRAALLYRPSDDVPPEGRIALPDR